MDYWVDNKFLISRVIVPVNFVVFISIVSEWNTNQL